MNEQLTRIEPQPLAQPQAPMDLLQLAVEKGANVETLERIMAVRREFRAEKAKEAFDEAMGAFQGKCPIIVKSRGVCEKNSDAIRYRFAPLDHIVKVVRPLLQEFGFNYQLDAKVADNWVEATCRVTHRLGHAESSTFKVPIDPKAFMSEQQKFASALTFAKRYAFVNAFGILTGDQDDDGNSAGKQGDGPDAIAALRKELWNLLKPVRGQEKTWDVARQYLIDECAMSPDKPVQEWDAATLRSAITKSKEKLPK